MLLSVVIPCFNEQGSVRRFAGELIPALDRLGSPYEVVAVDDGSSDGTAEALAALALGRSAVRVVTHPVNGGLGAALRSGFDQARGEWIVTLDADLTFHPAQIEALLRRQRESGADMVGGSPFLAAEGSAQVRLARRLPSLVLNGLYRTLFDRAFTSYTPVFRLYRARTLKALALTSRGFEINAEIAARLWRAGARLAETPVVLSTRREGTSKLSRARELKRHLALIARLLLQSGAS